MSLIYERYLLEKANNYELMYLFKAGNFYIFIDEDAKKIVEITPLNLTKLNNDIVKCGFPVNSLEKYLNVFKNLNLNIKIIEIVSKKTNGRNEKNIINKIKKLNIETITPLKALIILNELKDLVNE